MVHCAMFNSQLRWQIYESTYSFNKYLLSAYYVTNRMGLRAKNVSKTNVQHFQLWLNLIVVANIGKYICDKMVITIIECITKCTDIIYCYIKYTCALTLFKRNSI
jgi:hypothetical protein